MNLLKVLTAHFKYQYRQGSMVLVLALISANLVNFVYNAYLGRVLESENFGLVTLINTLLAMLTVIIGAFSSTVNHRSSFLTTNKNIKAAFDFFFKTRRLLITSSLIVTLGWLLSVPYLAKFFNIGDITSLIAFTPVIIFGLFAGINRGVLQSQILFKLISLLVISEALSKLVAAVILTQFGFGNWVYLSIPFSVLFSFILSYWFLLRQYKKSDINPKVSQFEYHFPKRFFVSSLIMGISTSGFLTVDLILVKHFLLPSSAGEYALLSLAGKMIFFFGSLLSGFIVTFVSRDLGQDKDPNPIFYKLLYFSIFLTAISYLGIGVFGSFIVPLLFGAKALPITPFLFKYGLAIVFFTISNCFVLYHLTRHHFMFSIITLLSVILMIGGISYSHSGISQIVDVIFNVSLFNIVVVFALHLVQKDSKFILRGLIDLIDIFRPFSKAQPGKEARRVLIYNWRDGKHKYAGGAEVYIQELAKRWVKEGLLVTIFCGNDGDSPREDLINGIHIIRRGGFYMVYIWAFWYYLIRFRGKFDVIIDCQNGIPFFTPLFAKEKIYCLMFHVHQEVFARSLSKPLALFAQVLENRLMPWAYRKVPFITISPSSKQEIQALDLGNAGIEIVYPGIDLNRYKSGSSKSSNPLILYVGRLQYYKSVDVLIQATKKIIKRVPKAQILIAGDGDKKQELESLAVSLGVDKKIIFLGKVSESEKVKLYQKAWVFVNPSLKEGWGITSIEANACGTPVVASNVPGLKDSVNDSQTGNLVDYGDADELANKVVSLVRNERVRSSMMQKSIEWAKQFDWQKSARKSLAILNI